MPFLWDERDDTSYKFLVPSIVGDWSCLKRERMVDYDPFAIGCGGFLAPNKGDWACLENLALPVCHWLWRCPRGNGSDPWVGEARRRSPEKLPIYQNHLL